MSLEWLCSRLTQKRNPPAKRTGHQFFTPRPSTSDDLKPHISQCLAVFGSHLKRTQSPLLDAESVRPGEKAPNLARLCIPTTKRSPGLVGLISEIGLGVCSARRLPMSASHAQAKGSRPNALVLALKNSYQPLLSSEILHSLLFKEALTRNWWFSAMSKALQ